MTLFGRKITWKKELEKGNPLSHPSRQEVLLLLIELVVISSTALYITGHDVQYISFLTLYGILFITFEIQICHIGDSLTGISAHVKHR